MPLDSEGEITGRGVRQLQRCYRGAVSTFGGVTHQIGASDKRLVPPAAHVPSHHNVSILEFFVFFLFRFTYVFLQFHLNLVR